MTVYSVVERASGRGRGGGLIGLMGGGGDGEGGTRVLAIAEGVVEVVAGGGCRRRRRVTVANETGSRGGKSPADWTGDGAGSRVSIGGAETKRTTLGTDVVAGGVG
jgi:hypothetical protein